MPEGDVHRLWQALHAAPEASGREQETSGILRDFLEARGVHVETGVGGHGLLARIGDGPAPLLRAELDALPSGAGARHGCGHDGHMAMLAGALAELAAGDRPVLALFQPSEEDGAGMARCLADARMADAAVTQAFAIHNIPGQPLGSVVVAPGALASTGVRIRLTGREAHAAHPKAGDNPYRGVRSLADAVEGLARDLGPHALATLIHIRVGDEAYGTSPGKAVVAATLRGSDDDVAAMRRRWLAKAPRDLAPQAEDVDPFPETANTKPELGTVRAAAQAAGLDVIEQVDPWPWSEDFGHAVARWGGALVGLGSGTDQPPLHDDDYVFPTALLAHGVRFWRHLVEAT